MADIFISYSKADRDHVLMLAAYLESVGWTVWWDTNLNPGDTYRDEIMRELATARAVIVLWTPHSIKSDFVRAEAGQAKAQGKLIPVKVSDVVYSDIPLPFGEMHTEDIAKRELIRAAVVAQLARPQVHPSAFWVTSKTLQYQILTWMGIAGGAVTLFTNLQGLLTLAGWAKWLVTNWQQWMNAIWRPVLALFPLKVPQYWVPLLSFAAFGLSIVFGQRMTDMIASRRSLVPHSYGRPALRFRTFTVLVLSFVCLPLALIAVKIYLNRKGITQGMAEMALPLVFLTTMMLAPIITFLACVERVSTAIVLVLSFLFYIAIALPGLTSARLNSFATLDRVPMLFQGTFFTLNTAITLLMLTFAPAKAIATRLLFLITGVFLLIALNQLSIYAPYIRELLKPPGS